MNIFSKLNEAGTFAQSHLDDVLVWVEDKDCAFDLELFSKNFKGDVCVLMTPADACMGDWELDGFGKIQEKEFSTIDGYWAKSIYALKGKTFLALLDEDGHLNLQLGKNIDLRGLAIPRSYPDAVPALFLDRDGVINLDTGYLHQKEHLQLHSGIVELILWANQKGWKVCVLTNQAGVAYGKFGIDALEHLHQHMSDLLAKEGAVIDGWYACPYVRSTKSLSSFNFDSVRRKPEPGLLLDACDNFSIDVKRSVMVGDKESDVLNIQGPEYLLVKRQYDLSSAQAPIFSSLEEIKNYLDKK